MYFKKNISFQEKKQFNIFFSITRKSNYTCQFLINNSDNTCQFLINNSDNNTCNKPAKAMADKQPKPHSNGQFKQLVSYYYSALIYIFFYILWNWLKFFNSEKLKGKPMIQNNVIHLETIYIYLLLYILS